MSPTLATQIPAGERALLEGGATRARTRALDLRRRPVDAADAQMQDQKRATAQRERVLIRTRTVWVLCISALFMTCISLTHLEMA